MREGFESPIDEIKDEEQERSEEIVDESEMELEIDEDGFGPWDKDRLLKQLDGDAEEPLTKEVA